METYFTVPFVGTGSNDVSIHIGWCPDAIRITEYGTGLQAIWLRVYSPDAALMVTATGGISIDTADAIQLVYFTDTPDNISADPTELTTGEFYKANGVRIDTTLAIQTDNKLCVFEAWRGRIKAIWAKHDGTTSANTYFEDRSVDFREAGVCGGQKWILYNINNNNYAFVKAVQKPSGQSKWCRVTLALNTAGDATTLADCDTNDIALLVPYQYAQYPISDCTVMT